MKIGSFTVHPHSASAHFTVALFPAAVFFLCLSYVYRPDDCRFAYFHLMILADLSVLPSFATGYLEWKRTYRGYRTRIFSRKILCGLAAGLLGFVCTGWYGAFPEIATNVGALRVLFLAFNVAIIPIVLYAGYLGGKLVFGTAH
jgi:uncharacterized membrane protein